MKFAKQLSRLGTETAFAVSGAATQWATKGHKVYPFHLGDINILTPESIIEATAKAIRDGYTGYCPGAGIPELRDAIARDVGIKRGIEYSSENVSIQPGGKPVIGKFIMTIMDHGSW
jgi:aspartate/methionine/tyrosine aminotransferase